MATVRGQESVVGIEIFPEVEWNTVQAGTLIRVPFLSSSDSTEADKIPLPNEIGTSGGNPGSELGQRKASGEFTTKMDGQEQYFGVLLGLTFGAEYFVTGTTMVGDSAGASRDHCFMPQSMAFGGKLPSFTLYMAKSGDAIGFLREVYSGAMITGVTFEQPASGPPTATWRWTAPPPVHDQAVALQLVGTRSIMQARSMSHWQGTTTDYGAVYIEHTATKTPPTTSHKFQIESLTITFERNIAFADGFITKTGLGAALGELEEPGYESLYDVEVTVNYPLPDDADNIWDAGGASELPYTLYTDGVTGKALRAVWETEDFYTGTVRRSFDVTIPNTVWTAGEVNLVSGALIATCTASGARGTVKRTKGQEFEQAWQTESPATNFNVPIHCQWVGNHNGRDAETSRMLTLMEGGNGPAADLYVAGTLPTLYFEMASFWFINDGSGEGKVFADADQLAPPDVNVSHAEVTDFRMRALIRAYTADPGSPFRLEQSYNGAAWIDVDAASSPIRSVDGSSITEAQDCSQILSKGSSFVAANDGIDDVNGIASEFAGAGLTMVAGEDTEVLYNFEIFTGSTSPGDTIDLRVAFDDGTPFQQYTRIGRVTAT